MPKCVIVRKCQTNGFFFACLVVSCMPRHGTIFMIVFEKDERQIMDMEQPYAQLFLLCLALLVGFTSWWWANEIINEKYYI